VEDGETGRVVFRLKTEKTIPLHGFLDVADQKDRGGIAQPGATVIRHFGRIP